MAQQQHIRRKLRRPSIGDMRDLVAIQLRALGSSKDGDADANVAFTTIANGTVFAAINTVEGISIFDNVNQQEVPITHAVILRHMTFLTCDHWIRTQDGVQLKVQRIENLDSRDRFLRLLCTERGSYTIEAAKV
jgi:SPP1 family predicted phage head-tail adaptor